MGRYLKEVCLCECGIFRGQKDNFLNLQDGLCQSDLYGSVLLMSGAAEEVRLVAVWWDVVGRGYGMR